jgi:hypothetical protein
MTRCAMFRRDAVVHEPGGVVVEVLLMFSGFDGVPADPDDVILDALDPAPAGSRG